MPIYEYYCPTCEIKFEKLRPMTASAEPAECPEGHQGAARVLSVFSAFGRGEDGEPMALAGAGGGCGCGGACSCGAF
ncbi:MAG: zinc ribbon domain-containing protein [Chloroflexi bacterium]|nr:zinc ribbon domain-containing protein [Chloroflexota bacterium]